MEPITSLFLAGGAGGAGSKIAEKVWNLGETIFTGIRDKYGKKAADKGRDNIHSFTTIFGNLLLFIVEQHSKTRPASHRDIEEACGDPAFFDLLHRTLYRAAITSSQDKHKILARLILEKLLSRPESTVSLVTNAVVDKINFLTTKQLYILGILEVLIGARPTHLSAELPESELNKEANRWWETNVSALVSHIPEITDLDIGNLNSQNCIQFRRETSLRNRMLSSLLQDGFGAWDIKMFLASPNTGAKLENYYKTYLKGATFTTIGSLIGIYVKDAATSSVTTLNWSTTLESGFHRFK